MSEPSNGLRCSVWVPQGRCRNKVVVEAPNGAGGMKALCKRHADQYAREIVTKNHELYWALAWQRNIANA